MMLSGIRDTVQSNIMRSVPAPLDDLFQEGAVLQRRRGLPFLRDIIKNVRSLAFPNPTSQSELVCTLGNTHMSTANMSSSESVKFLTLANRTTSQSTHLRVIITRQNLKRKHRKANQFQASRFGGLGKVILSALYLYFHSRIGCQLWERGLLRG
jgi:hypothetical protein